MADQPDNPSEIKKALSSAKSVVVLFPQNPTLDTTAASLSLFLSLKEAGKNTAISSPSEMRVEQSRLVGIDKISTEIGNRNLVVSFDYHEDSIEKVSYNVENQKFNLVIQPRSGFSPLDPQKVEYFFEGLEADLIFVLGAPKLENLGPLYEKEREAFAKSTLVNIDRNPANSKFAKINLLEPKSVSLTDLVFHLLKQLELPINADIAGNLLKGIEAQTQNLQSPSTGPETFETVAELIRLGAKRSMPSFPPVQSRAWNVNQPRYSPPNNPQSYPSPQPQFPSPDPQFPYAYADWQTPSHQALPPFPQPPNNGQLTPAPEIPVAATLQKLNPLQTNLPPQPQNPNPADQSSEIAFGTQLPRTSQPSDATKDDWLAPKIYQGKTQV